MKIHPLGKITDAEKVLIEAAIPQLDTNIQTVINTCLFFEIGTLINSNLSQGSNFVLDAYKAEGDSEGPSKL